VPSPYSENIFDKCQWQQWTVSVKPHEWNESSTISLLISAEALGVKDPNNVTGVDKINAVHQIWRSVFGYITGSGDYGKAYAEVAAQLKAQNLMLTLCHRPSNPLIESAQSFTQGLKCWGGDECLTVFNPLVIRNLCTYDVASDGVKYKGFGSPTGKIAFDVDFAVHFFRIEETVTKICKPKG